MKAEFNIKITGKVEPIDLPMLLEDIAEKVDAKLHEEPTFSMNADFPDLYELFLRRGGIGYIKVLPSEAEVIVAIKVR